MIKGASSAPPARQQPLLAIIAEQSCCGLDKQPQNEGAIIAGQLDQIGLGDEVTKFDHLVRAFATLTCHARVSCRTRFA